MGRDTRISATIDIGAKIDQFESAIHKIQGELGKLSIDNITKGDFESIFKNLETRIKNIQSTTKEGQLKLIDEKKTTEEFNKLASGYKELIAKLKSSNVNTSFLEKDAKVIEALKAQIGTYTREVERSNKAWSDQEKNLKALLAQARALKTEAKNEYDAAKDSAKAKIDAERDINKAKKENLTTAKHELAELEKQKNAQEKFASAWKKQHDNMRGMNTAYASKTGNTWDPNIVTKYNEAVNKVTQAQNEANVAQERFNQVSQENNTNSYADLKLKLDQANQAVREAEVNLKTFQATNAQIDTTTFDKIRDALLNIPGINWAEYNVDPSTIKSIEDLQRVYSAVSGVAAPKAEEAVRIINEQLNIAKSSGEAARQGYNEAAEGVKKLGGTASDIERLTGRLVRFFSIDNAVRLFRRAIRSATETVKELDKAMTETAVVTNFTVGDMWKTLPEYTKRANELGLAVKDVYEASTLYYQQGLSTQEVVSLTNATLRMARIASLDAADATDRMTNALRGFNMELTQANADNVADVYSKLAAISASNVDEISTAMTKVASLAHSANMEFENTAAFLAQIIETTRESAETAGTALKTVVARFSEVKSLYTKGDLLGTDEEGEEIDVNKVSKALRTAGINLNEFLTGQKGLDEIFMELAEKWDSLDIVQQRYIATMAAGSRQQSRFIALMSDYKRTVELTTAANSASGASMEQYNKTLESVETKINQLKNAWNEFLMGIANDEFIKKVLDFANDLLSGINKITDGISGGNGLLKALANIGVAIGALKLGKTILVALLGNPATQAKGFITQLALGMKGQSAAMVSAGATAGTNFMAGFTTKMQTFKSVNSSKGFMAALKNSLGLNGNAFNATDLGLKEIRLDTAGLIVDTKSIDAFQGKINSMLNSNQINIQQYNTLTNALQTKDVEKFNTAMKETGQDIKLTGEQADQCGVKFKNMNTTTNKLMVTSMALGAGLLMLSNILSKSTSKSAQQASIWLRNLGIAFMAIGPILKITGANINIFSKEATASISTIPIIGWIAAIISLLVALGLAFAETFETPEKKIQSMQDNLAKTTEAVEALTSSVENLNSAWDSLQEHQKNIEQLIRGTKEWREEVQKNNTEVMELLQTYSDLQVENDHGYLRVTNMDQIIQAETGKLLLNQTKKQAEEIQVRQATVYNDSGLERAFRLYGQDSKGNNYYAKILEDILSGTVTNVNTLVERMWNNEYGTIGNTYAGTTDQRAFEIMQQQAQEYQKINQELDAYYTSITAGVLAQKTLTEAQEKYVDTLTNDNTFAKEWNQQWNKRTKYENLTDEEKEAYKKYVEDLFGEGKSINIGNNGHFTYRDEENKKQEKDYADVLAGFAHEMTIEQTDKSLTYMLNILEQWENSSNTIVSSLSNVFEQDNLTQQDLFNIFGEKANEIASMNFEEFANNTEYTEQLKTIWKDENNINLRRAYRGNFEAFLEDIYNETEGAFDLWFNKIKDPTLQKRFEGLDYSTSNAIFNALTSAFNTQDIDQFIPDKTLIKNEDKYKDFLNAFSKLNFRNVKDLDNFSQDLADLGIVINESEFDEFIEKVKKAAHSLTQIDLTKFNEQAKDMAKIISDIRGGKQTREFSEDMYNKLIDMSPELASQFTYREDGSYLYLGDKLDNIVMAINNQTNDLLGKGREQIEAKELAFNIATNIKDGVKIGDSITELVREESGYTWERYRAATQEDVDRDYMQQVINAYKVQGKDVGNLGINGLLSNDIDLSQIGADTLAQWRKEFTENIAANYSTWKGQREELDNNVVLTNAMAYTPEQLAQNYGYVVVDQKTNEWRVATEEEQSAQQKALLSKLSMVAPEEILNQYLNTDEWSATAPEEISRIYNVYAEAAELGLDTSLMQEWTAELQRTKNLNLDVASEIALANTKLNNGVKKIIDSYEDWEDLIGKNGPLGKGAKFEFKSNEENEQYQALKKNLELALDLNGSLSDSFFESEKNIEAIDVLTNGTFEEKEAALEYLRKAAAINVTENIENAKFDIDNLVNYIDTLDIPDIEVGATVKDEQLQAGLSKIVAEAGDAANDIINALGFTTDYEQIGTKKVFTGWKTVTTHAGYGIDEMENIPQFKEVPIYRFVAKGNGEGGSGHSGLSPSNGSTTGKKDSNSKDSKNKNWKNPYDELYNLQEHINSALREREKLEANYQRMLEDHRTVGEDLQKQSLKEIASLQKQLYYQKQMMAGREKQMANVLNETYEDSEGNRKTYGSMGLQKYAWYEEDTQTVHIEWDKINQVTDEDQGKAIEAYVSRLEELRDQMQDVEDAIDEANDQIREIQMRNTEEYIDFEQRVYDALVNQYQKEIDMLGEVNQSITDATNKTLDAISEEIEKERQARENEKAREELSDKEARLAYLQRDTSGMNALEIQKLQQELENERQSYQDSIVDQTLQEMRDEAARAEAQRQAQIDMMQGQLDWWQEVGYPLWERVETLMDTGVDNTGKIISDSALDQLLTANDNVAAMSKIAAFKWTQDLAKEVAAQFEGKANWMMEMARDTGEATDANGKRYKYNASENKWYDENGNEVNVYYRNGQYVAEKVQKPKEVSVGSGAQQPGSGGGGTPSTPTPVEPETPPTHEKGDFITANEPTNTYQAPDGRLKAGQIPKNSEEKVLENTEDYYKTQLGYVLKNRSNVTFARYARGGLADFTGPAWLDGTKSHPEMVLNATDTQNLITLKNILGAILQNTTGASKTSTGDNYFDINIDAQISSDYDVDQLSERIKKQIYDDATYRNVNTLHYIR